MMLASRRFRRIRGRSLAVVLLILLGALAPPALATSLTDLPPALQSLPPETFMSLFSVSLETPNVAAEVARLRVYTAPNGDPTEAPLAALIAKYPRTADARRALLDIGAARAKEGDWVAAEAPFRYVMEQMPGSSEARIAHLRLLEMYRYSGVPEGTDLVASLRAAAEAYAGTPEEGLGRLLLADVLAEKQSSEAAFAEYQRVIEWFPLEPYAEYAHIHYALALVRDGKANQAVQALSPVLADPVWGGRAYHARGAVHDKLGMPTAAIVDYQVAARTADSLWFRSEAFRELARLYASQGDLVRANDCLQASLDSHPFRGDILPIRVDMLRNTLALGDPARAAQLARDLMRDARNPTWQFPAGQVEYALGACEEALAKCQSAVPETGGEGADAVRAEDPSVRLQRVRALLPVEDPARLAVMAMNLRVEVQNNARSYRREQIDETARGCLEIMEQCERALSEDQVAAPDASVP